MFIFSPRDVSSTYGGRRAGAGAGCHPIDTKAIPLACWRAECCEHGHDATQSMVLCRRAAADRGCLQQVMRCCIPEVDLAEVTDKKLPAPHTNPSSCFCSLVGQLLNSLCGGIFPYIERFHHLADSTYFCHSTPHHHSDQSFCVASLTKPKQQDASLIRNPRAYPPHVRQELPAKGTHPPFPVHDVHQGR